MTDALSSLLAERGVLLADGATGTNLFEMGLESGEAPELWCAAHPDRVRALHQGFVDAGADIILSNSFGGTRHRLKLHHAQDRVLELNRMAAAIARDVADAADRTVIVAGSVGPTGELLVPLGALTYDEAVAAFAEQIEGLKAGGADVIWVETMSAPDEMKAAIEAARRHEMPVTVTASFDTAGRTMMGVLPAEMSAITDGALAFGANCGVGASDILASLLEMGGDRPVIVKGNCGIPQFRGAEVHYSGTPEQMAEYTRLAIDAGARIIGGCCGTSFEHLRVMRAAMDEHRKGDRPTIDAITERVGPLVNAVPGGGDAPKRERKGRRRAA